MNKSFAASILIVLAFTLVGIAQSPIDYFRGTWKIVLKNDPGVKLKWTVTEDLGGKWLNGKVQTNGTKTSTDYLRVSGHKIQRIAFTSAGLFVEVESSGWEGSKLVFTGFASDPAGLLFKVRETITKRSDKEFHALWERPGTRRQMDRFLGRDLHKITFAPFLVNN